jgi:menaquinone-specific isochorismate synthase
MTILPLNPADHASPEALRAFLGECRETARRDRRTKLVSISLAVDALDPLAVLESIFEPGEPHFYAERPGIASAIAGAEIAAVHEASGPDRFASVQRFVHDTLAHTIAVGDVTAPFGGPHFFTAFAFHDEVEPCEPFPAARVFVPRWQVARAGDTTTAVANVPVAPDADLAALADRVWRAHEKFRRGTGFQPLSADRSDMGILPISKGKPRAGSPCHTNHVLETRATSPEAYRAVVARALALIAAGEFEKIVLARALDLTVPQPLHPLRVLHGLRQRFPDCYSFSVASGSGPIFIGASPERLVRVSQGVLETEALAGSAPRGTGASEDATRAAALLASEKDRREHRLVLDSIVRRLAPLGLKLDFPEKPTVRRFANVQHLHTPVRAALPENVRLLDALARLHPTPAVGGTPRAAAVGRIRELEGFPRGLYAGALGWINARGGGEFFVGIRSAFIVGASARVLAGAGIVAGSDPEKEFAETELKLQAMLEALGP